MTLRQLLCAHPRSILIRESRQEGRVAITRVIDDVCIDCGRRLTARRRVRPHRLSVSVLIGLMGSVFVLGFRSEVPADPLTFGLAFGGFIVTTLAFAWWLDHYHDAVERGEIKL